MTREKLITVAQKAILENAHNLAASAVVQSWQTRKIVYLELKVVGGTNQAGFRSQQSRLWKGF